MCHFCSGQVTDPCLKTDLSVPSGNGDIVVSLDDIALTIPDNSSTGESISVGQTRFERLDYAGDEDWFRVTLTEGQTIEITLDGSGADPLTDPYLRLYDANSSQVAFNDDGGPGLNSRIVYTVNASGTYYVEVDSYAGAYDGDYRLTVREVAPPNLTDVVQGQTRLNTNDPVQVYFSQAGDSYTFQGTTYVAEGVNAYEQAQLFSIFEGVEEFLDIDFQITSNRAAADLEWATDNLGGSLLGFFFFPDTFGNGGYGVLNSAFSGWSTSPGGGLDTGGFMYGVSIHELGHGLGLGHTHDSGNGTQVMTGVTSSSSLGSYNLNQSIFSQMSYNDGWRSPFGTPGTYDYGYGASFGAIDIAALQEMYGANTTHAGGNDVYQLADANASGTGYSAIWDTGGTDEIRYSGSRDTVLDLRAATLEYETGGGGFVNYASGIHGGFTIASGVVIENASGGSGDDLIRGNASSNLLSGGNGRDSLEGGDGDDRLLGGADADELVGGDGDDTLDGGAGNDTAFFTHLATDYVFGPRTGDRVTATYIGAESQDDGTDLLIGIETLTFADTSIAFTDLPESSPASAPDVQAQSFTVHETAWNGWVLGLVTASDPEGDPITFGLAGEGAEDFSLDAMTGKLTLAAALDYESRSTYALDLTVSDETSSAQAVLTINVTDVQEGTAGPDSQNSNSASWFQGSEGADLITGRPGVVDTVDYSGSTGAVTVDLGGSPSQGYADGDQLVDIENVFGSSYADFLTGDATHNELWGWLGNDWLSGGDGNDSLLGDIGNDRLKGGRGADLIDGGDGTDRADFDSAYQGVTVDLEDDSQNAGEAAGDTLISIEQLYGSTHGDDLRGNTGSNWLWGASGDDSLTGRDGSDFLLGGLGADILNGGAGTDRAQYSDATSGVTVDLNAAGNNTGEAAGDSFISVENLFGSLYGDDLRGNAVGNWLWGWNGDDSLDGSSGNDVLLGGLGADILNGGLGNDRAQYSDATTAVLVDFANVAANTGEAAGDTYIGIEALFGSSHGDDLRGNAANDAIFGWLGDDVISGRGGTDLLLGNEGNDRLNGGDGNDRLEGGLGGDVHHGGAGKDRVQFTGATTGVTASLEAPTGNTGEAAGDVYIEVEDIYGSAHGDSLAGDGASNWIWGWLGDDQLEGQGGDDFLIGGTGADAMDGGAGIDRAHYADAVAAVTMSLASVAGSTGEAAGDTFTNIENIFGTRFDDQLGGDDLDNWIWGWFGNDQISGAGGNDVLIGGLGADSFDGGAGFDQVRYSDAGGAVTVDLQISTNSTGDAAGDSFTSVENVYGSLYGDDLRGDARANQLFGWLGDDRIDGRDGNDAIFGLEGNDTLTGGVGFDAFWFTTGSGADIVTDFEIGVDLIRITGTGLRFEDLTIGLNGGNALVDFGGGSFVLEGILAGDLSQDHFLFT